MPYYVRPMRKEDIPQASAIDREAFATMWPPTNFHYELTNWMAHYVVACEGIRPASPPPAAESAPVPKVSMGFFSRLKALFQGNHATKPQTSENVIGFAGFWVMAGEAHVTNIAVREQWRGKGVGELLIISALDQAIKLDAQEATLEVRVSNTVAQNLYRKYGFNEMGVRREYYTDNKEDALIMTTDKLDSTSFQARFQKLKEAYAQKRQVILAEVTPV
ncbi:MAG: ribosomal protein S18-alanine N-acetyltransferase [Chloroflexi bacterium]|nr:ribosomal protein S18-alanine N-acetyltransferase [Chloroflexota bacterium]